MHDVAEDSLSRFHHILGSLLAIFPYFDAFR